MPRAPLILLASLLFAPPLFGQRPDAAPAPAGYTLLPHADSQLAHELLRLKQVDAIKAQLQAAKGTPAENLWNAQLVLALWDDSAKSKDNSGLAASYLPAVTAYLKSQPAGIDGSWALDHAQFILSKLSQPIITRMEYWSNNAKDRAALAPLASAASDLLAVAGESLDAAMKAAESRKPFDEGLYTRTYNASVEVRYYAAWAAYFRAMAMHPAKEEAPRQKILSDATAALSEWAVDEPDNGVNAQAYLLRGKIYIESREFTKAVADFGKAEVDKAPPWVQFQSRYQTVVAYLRAGEFKLAQSNLDAFKRWIPSDNQDARLSADMLGYRVAWAMADSRPDGAQQKEARLAALGILQTVIQKDPRFRELVYEQLATQIPENADPATLLPMQQLAMAFIFSQGQKGDTPESRRQLKLAADAAVAVRNNITSSVTDKSEATYLAGACNAVLGNLFEAARYNVEFAEKSPGDPRAKQMVEIALQQIGQLRKAAPAPANGEAAGMTPDLRELSQRALHLSVDVFGDARWKYAQARMLEESGKLAEASAIYQALPADDKNYFDARYRMVTLATERFSKLPAKTSEPDMQAAARNVFDACSSFLALLDKPPASVPADVLERAKSYRYDILIIEAATALNPAVKQTDIAIDRLTKLDAAKSQLSETQKGAVLRYRILAYQMAGQPDKAFAVVQEYAKANGQEAMGVIRSMALSTMDEINRVEPTDPAAARRLAVYVVQLLDPIINQSIAEKKDDTVFEYRLIKAEMMVRAGQYKDAQSLAVELQHDRPPDLRPFMTEARSIFAEAQATGDQQLYAKAQDYFERILKRLAPGSESSWETWLRIIQSMEMTRGEGGGGGVGEGTDAAREIRQKLSDLKGSYGSKFGGELYKADFDKLAAKYGVR
jgi:hypothetical protein